MLRKEITSTIRASSGRVQVPPELSKLNDQLNSVDPKLFKEDFEVLPYAIDVLDAVKDDALQDLYRQKSVIDVAIATIVDGHHAEFNSSVRNFTRIYGHITETQDRVQKLRTMVSDVRKLLTSKTENLRQLWIRKLEYEHAIKILDKVEEVKRAPGEVDALISSKRYLAAVTTLNQALSHMFGDELLAIETLADVRTELMERKQMLEDVLVAEIQNTIYQRWKEPRTVIDSSFLGDLTVELEEQVLSTHGKSPRELIKFAVEALDRLGRTADAVSSVKESTGSRLQKLIAQKLENRVNSRGSFRNEEDNNELPAVFRSRLVGEGLTLPSTQNLIPLLQDILHDFYCFMENHLYFLEVLKSKNRPSYTAKDTWGMMQSVLQDFLAQYLDDTRAITSANPAATAPEETRNIFSFGVDKSVEIMPTSDAQNNRLMIATPSPFHICALYSPILIFIERMDDLIATDGGLADALAGYINQFIHTVFVPRLNSDLQKRLAVVLEDKEAFDVVNPPVELATSKPRPNLMVVCALHIDAILQQIHRIMTFLPKYSKEIALIAEKTALQWIDKCQATFRRLNGHTYTAHWMKVWGDQLHQLMQSDHLFRNAKGVVPSSTLLPVTAEEADMTDEARMVKERAIEAEFYDFDRLSVSRNNVVKSAAAWQQMGAINVTCDWMVIRYLQTFGGAQDQQLLQQASASYKMRSRQQHVEDISSQSYLDTLLQRYGPLKIDENPEKPELPATDPPSPVSKRSSLSPTAIANLKRPSILTTSMAGKTTISGASGTTKGGKSQADLQTGTGGMSSQMVWQRCSALADEILLYMRQEVRVRACFFFKQSHDFSYNIKDENVKEPLPFVIELQKELLDIESGVSSSLPSPKIRFIFNSLSTFLPQLLMHCLHFLAGRTVTKGGVQQLVCNAFAVQQNLANVAEIHGGHRLSTNYYQHFQQARRLYSLLTLSEDDLLRYIAENKEAFSYEVYRSLWLVGTPDRIPSNDTLSKFEAIFVKPKGY